MKGLSRTKTTPVPVQRTVRRHPLRTLTSLPAGKMVPLAAIPLLREDSVTRATMQLSFEMLETVEILMNAVHVNVKAYLVPNLAFERFNGLDSLNRSYEGIPENEGDDVIPYFETMVAPAHGANEVFTYMGKHFRPGQTISTAYVEAYNEIWNFRARNRSPDIELRDRLDGTLAPAFWQHSQFDHIVPDFDQAIIDGEVPLNVVNAKLPVQGLGLRNTQASTYEYPGVRTTTGTSTEGMVGKGIVSAAVSPGVSEGHLVVKSRADDTRFPDVWAELADNGITVSLSNIEAARRTQAFARLRQQYTGHTDEYIIDLLMDGISVPEQAWKQPILLADKSTVFGMAKRYATDSGSLTESVVNGGAAVGVNLTVPRVPTGGIIVLVAEITPEQLFERQQDPYLFATSVEQLPQFVRDTLDPEKVAVVRNEYIDIDHDTPNGTFGYAPLNHEWTHTAPQIGGRFYRPEVDAAFDEDRQRIWAVETQNPVLSADFYLCTTMHTKPFVVSNQDPFDVVVRGDVMISGNTVFGGLLIEGDGDYEAIAAEIPQDRVAK